MLASPLPVPHINAAFPPKLQCLFMPKWMKILYGGRGAGRSWGCARALLIIAVQRKVRVLCVRELQKSIAESVHRLLCDQIRELKLEDKFIIQQNKIYGTNGSEFAFEGIKNNVTAIKSYEGIDYCWVEEANKVTKNSWEVLLPTIRREGSEVWVTFNPELEEDYTYETFVKNADREHSFVVHMTYRDNPWFPSGLRIQMNRMKQTDEDAYNNVWEGRCKKQLEGVVYAKEMRKAYAEGRVTHVPWERSIPLDVFMDLGRADHTSLWLAQRVGMQRRVVHAYQNTGYDITFYIKYLQGLEYTFGTVYLPHDGKSKMIGSRLSVEQTMRAANFRVRVMPRIGIAEGIQATRLMFNGLVFDEKACSDGLYALNHYRYQVIDGRFSNEPLHDEHSDFADALRTMALAFRPKKDKKDMTPAERVKEMLENASGAAGDFLSAKRERGREISTDPGLDWLGE